MNETFEIDGFFYQIGDKNFRKYLDIKRKKSKITLPDLMVVMMNPGSSFPIDGIDNNTKATPAIPDKTQEQIIKVMINCNYHFARILNLSDLRTPKSEALYKFLKSDESKNIPHSIFSTERLEDFKSLYIPDVPIIYAWGVHNALEDLAKEAIERINHSNPIGWKKKGKERAYYHPLPRSKNEQLEWVDKITKLC